MSKQKKSADDEIEVLDEFLQDEFNHDIYEELTDADEWTFELFQPLEFLRLFYEQVDYIRTVKKPLSVARQLKGLSLSDEQSCFLYDKLLRYFSTFRRIDKQIEVCCREILKLMSELDLDEEPELEEETPNPFDFDSVLKHIKTLPTAREKIAYLIEKRTAYNQSSLSFWNLDPPSFAEKCKMEIEKIEKLEHLQPVPKIKTVEVGKHKDLTLDRATLILSYLFTYAKANCHNTKKAEAISFLTGFSSETIRQKLSNLHSKDNDKSFYAYKEDMRIVRRYFENLNLPEIVKMIDRDLENA